MARGEIATGINCYMKQYVVTEEEAFLDFDRKVKHASKLVNEEYLKTNMPLKIARVALNLGRAIDANYKHGDGLTYTEIVLNSSKNIEVGRVHLTRDDFFSLNSKASSRRCFCLPLRCPESSGAVRGLLFERDMLLLCSSTSNSLVRLSFKIKLFYSKRVA